MKIKIKGKQISVNQMYTGRRFLTSKGRSIKEDIGWQVKKGYRGKPLKGLVIVDVVFYFKNNRSDIDNCLKGLLDSLRGIIYEDDKQIVELHVWKNVDKKSDPYTLIEVNEFEK